MLKKLLIILVVVVLLAGVALFLALRNIESIVARYKPELENRISQELNTEVALGDIEVSLWPTTRFAINEIALGAADNREFQLDELIVQVNLIPAIRGVIDINEITLSGLVVQFEKRGEEVSIRGLSKRRAAPAGAPAEPSEQIQPADEAATSPPFELHLSNFRLNNAQISYFDRESGAEHHIDALNLHSGLHLDSEKLLMPSLTVAGELRDVTPFALEVNHFEFGLETQRVQLKQANLEVKDGKMRLEADYDLKNSSGQARLTEAAVTPLNLPITMQAILDLTAQQVHLRDAKFNLLEGEGKADFTLDTTSDTQPFSSKTEVAALNLGQLFEAVAADSPMKVRATLNSFSSEIRGALGVEDLKHSLNGRASFQIVDGEIQGLGIADQVLSRLVNLPFIQDSLEKELPPEERAKIKTDSTAIRKMSADINIANSVIRTNNFVLQSDLFDLEGRGQVTMDAEFDLVTTLAFHPVVSNALVGKVKEFEALLDNQERLAMPVRLRGTPGKISVTPDIDQLMQGALGKKVEREAGRLLDRALGGRRGEEAGADKKQDSNKKQDRGLRGVLGF